MDEELEQSKAKRMRLNDQESLEVDTAKDNRHGGSYDLNSLKQSSDYLRFIAQDTNSVKRKYALCLGYIGSKYQGLQINPGAKTVEAELERALFLAGGISEANFGFMSKVQWTRAARTDRGVHAVAQCCSMKLELNLDSREKFIEQVNSFLPSDITLHSMTKVTKQFNAKNLCGMRTYHYLLPTYLLQTVTELNSIFDCGVAEYQKESVIQEGDNHSTNKDFLFKCREKLLPYRISKEKLDLLQELLNKYVGTKSYHNFTSGKDSTDADSKRYIVSFTAGVPFISNLTNVEWILLEVKGQSFLLNQIRKMVAFAVDVVRGFTSIENLSIAFSKERMEIPMAPGLGLYLHELSFEGYNIKQRREAERDRLTQQKKLSVNHQATNDEEEDKSNREEINWHTDINVTQKLNEYQDKVLHPHIILQLMNIW